MALAGSFLLSLVPVRAGEVVINNFDDPAEVLPYAWETWSAPTEVGFDTLNASGGLPGSGSLRITNNFPNNPGGYDQCVFTGALPGGQVDAVTLYSKISLDLRLDPLSYPRANANDYGQLELHLRNGSAWTWIWAGQTRFTNNNWVHYSFDVPTTADQVHHLTFKLGENNLTNTVIYNVDNIRWTESTAVPPPPTVSLEKTEPGLNFVAASGGRYDRQSIATVANTFGWIGSSAPMSYSMTISKFPNATTYGGYSAHFYLVPGLPGTEDAPDWNEPTCALISIHANANGTATMEYHYKTNAPGSNGKPTLDGTSWQYFNPYATNGPVGWIGNVTGAAILGTWTVTFNQDTNITMKAPDGTTSSFVMPPEDAAQFAGQGTVYYGIVPGETANVGQKAILSRVEIMSGATTLLEDNFSVAPLDSAVWNIRAVSPAGGVALITANEPYYVWWTTPATGFTLQINA
ncbi:MAG: hypothetical protein DME26_03045, partial [Verrucomicrobia bacterium]